MKKRLFVAVILVLAFGMSVISCDTGDSGSNPIGSLGLNGTWYSYGNMYKYQFNNGDYEQYYNGNPYRKGTYTNTSDSMTMTITYVGSYSLSSYTWLNSSTWYSRDEFRAAYLSYVRSTYESQLSSTRSQLQQTYSTYASYYGASRADSYFISAYGTADIDSIINKMVNDYVSQAETTIDSSTNALFPQPSTVAYSLNGNTLILGGTSLTRD